MDYLKARKDLQKTNFNLGTEGTSLSFPLKKLPTEATKLHSPRIGKKYDVEPFDRSKYEEYMWEVNAVRDLVQKGVYPIEFLRKYWPAEWGELPVKLPEVLRAEGLRATNPRALANVVHMDKPVDLGFAMMNYLGKRKNAKRLKDGNTTNVDFLERGPNFIAGMTNAINEALNKVFEVKYYYGVARPEEIYEKLTGNTGKDITAYNDDSYNHCSYPAGHSSASGATARFFIDSCELDEVELSEIRRAAYLWGMFRTFAGVHYAVDNLAGLKLGGLV